MTAEADQDKNISLYLVDKEQVGVDMAFSEAIPRAFERMISVLQGERMAGKKEADHLINVSITAP